MRVVVLRGAGDRAFVSGADTSEFEKNRSSEDSRRIFDEKGKLATAINGRGHTHLCQRTGTDETRQRCPQTSHRDVECCKRH